jgi:hypothetical protein
LEEQAGITTSAMYSCLELHVKGFDWGKPDSNVFNYDAYLL